MFIDTSVLVAILAKEPEALAFTRSIEHAAQPMTSPLVLLEATMRISTLLRDHPHSVLSALKIVVAEGNISIMPIEAEHAELAIDAFARFGKGRGHPAQLNLADCLSYACAKSRGLPLLYKGSDFARTDLG